MEPLKLHRQILTWLCIYPAAPNTSLAKKALYVGFSVFLYISSISGLVTSFEFFATNVSVNVEAALYALFQVSAFLSLVYMASVAFISRSHIVKFIETLEQIYEANKNNDSFRYFIEANDKTDWIWRFYFKFGMCGFGVSTVCLSMISVLFGLLIKKDFHLDYLYWPYRTTLPWDQYTRIGYFWTICYDILIAESYFMLNGANILLFIAICWHHQAFYLAFQNSSLQLDSWDRRESAKRILIDLGHFHESAKSWFMQSARVYNRYVMIQLACSVLLLACSIFQLDLQLQHIDYNILILWMAVFVSSMDMFMYCYFGKVATESYAKMADSLFESKWYEHSNEIQKYFILMIMNTQKPIYYRGFGMVVLNLETFSSMIKRAFNYYLMFKALTSHE